MVDEQPRVLMIALDSLDAAVLDRGLARGDAPVLARMAAGASRLAVRSDGELLHGSVWPTFAMGTPPGHHGMYFWQQWLAEEMRHVRSNHPAFANTPFWAGLPAANMRATVIDVPYVPSVESKGFRTVQGWGMHDEMAPVSYPAPLLRQIRRRFGRHPLGFDTVEPQSPREKRAMGRAMVRGAGMRLRLLTTVARRRNWNLLISTFGEFHKAGHYLAIPEDLGDGITNDDLLDDLLRAFDAGLSELLEAAGPDCHVFVFALHGVAPQVEYSALGPQVLRAFAGEAPSDPAQRPDVIRRIRELLPDPLHRAIWARLPARVRNARQGALTSGNWDYARDRLFTVTQDGHIGVRVNLEGRERDGIVPVADLPRLLDDLERFVHPLLAADGQPAFHGLWRASREAPGPRSHRLPDALIVANPAVMRTNSLRGPGGLLLESRRPEARNGVHTSDGFCLYLGDRRPLVRAMDNLDFAPSVLSLLGVTPPPGLHGRDVFS